MSIHRLLTALLCLLATPAIAQYTVGRVVFNGSGPYQQAALEKTCGLHSGLTLSKDAMQKSAQQLIDTGLFDDVRVTLNGPVQAVTVLFTLKPIDPAHLLIARFDNFVWWSPAELTAAIQSAVPLFSGSLPEAGALQDDVQAALQRMLAAKNITATISHDIPDPSTGHPVRSIDYKIDSPAIHLRTVTLTGVSSGMAPAIDKITSTLIGHDDLTAGNTTTADRILAPYRDAGYFEAALSQQHRTLSVPSPGNVVHVDLTATVEPGEVYRLSHIDFAGAPLLSPAQFITTAQLHPEDLVSQKAILATLQPLDEIYRRNGYLDVVANAVPAPDAATHHVAYTVTLTPGEQYHLRSITPINLLPQKLSQFQAAWKLSPGDVYNPFYVRTFLLSLRAAQHPFALPESFKQADDTDAHLVDLTITFVANAH